MPLTCPWAAPARKSGQWESSRRSAGEQTGCILARPCPTLAERAALAPEPIPPASPALPARAKFCLALAMLWLAGFGDARAIAQPANTSAARHPSPRPPLPWVVEGEFTNSHFAYQMAPAGDVNMDGFDDVLIAEPGFDGGRGQVLAYYGSSKGLPARPSWTACGEMDPQGGQRRQAATGIGDLDKDGFDDIAVVSEGLAQGWRAAPTLGKQSRPAQPQRGCGPNRWTPVTTPLGLRTLACGVPRVARSSQPWAGSQNPVGIRRYRPPDGPTLRRMENLRYGRQECLRYAA